MNEQRPNVPQPPTLAIVTSGGPAPGINSVISAATIEAINLGWRVIGIHDGFRGLVENRIKVLTLDDVAFIHFDGGSILGMSRINLLDPKYMRSIVDHIQEHNITMLLTIGGDGTASGASLIASRVPGLRTVHVPKTIDNDLPLPEGVPTFGFTTARQVGVSLVQNLMKDARTCVRWYLVVTMGRQSGHLALGIAKAAGANLALIPEEFEDRPVTLNEILDILEGAVIKSLMRNRPWGVAVLAEGLVERLSPQDLSHLPDLSFDEFGHVRLSNVRLGELLAKRLEARMQFRQNPMRFNDIKLGYELRCADPVPFDIEYTRELGFAAIRFLAEGGSSAMVSIDKGKRKMISFDDLKDQKTGVTQVRHVNIHGESYLVARRYMQRLSRLDFQDDRDIERLADAANCSPEAFVQKFKYLISNEPSAFAWDDNIRDTLDF